MVSKFKGFAACSIIFFGLPLASIEPSRAADISWFAPVSAGTSNANWPAGTNYTNNYGVAFTTGSDPAGYEIDWIKLGLNTSSSTSGTGSIKVALRSTTNSTAYSAVAGSLEYALDQVSFTAPTTTATQFELMIRADQLPNISTYSMAASSSYALVLYNPIGGNWGMARTTGYATGTTNTYYTTSNGFAALDTFRNNIANYSNNTSSYPTLAISFGATSVPVSQAPGPLPVLGVPVLFSAARRLREEVSRRRGQK